MIGRGPGRDGEIEAFIVDRYLESLLARSPRDVTDVPTDMRATAARLIAGLPRYHPSFRFEEDLAARLLATATAPAGELIDFPARLGRDLFVAPEAPIRPTLIGGVLTSAAVSLVGAAYVAWRYRRPRSPMARAMRAVARARTV